MRARRLAQGGLGLGVHLDKLDPHPPPQMGLVKTATFLAQAGPLKLTPYAAEGPRDSLAMKHLQRDQVTP